MVSSLCLNSVTNADGYNTPLRDKEGNESRNDISFPKLLKHHVRDWIMVILVAIVEVCVYVAIPPYHRFVGQFNIDDYRYPRKSTTIPTWTVLVSWTCFYCVSLLKYVL